MTRNMIILLVTCCSFWSVGSLAAQETKSIKVGLIGLDTSHSIAFSKLLNAEDAAADVAHCKVVIAYPFGSADIESSASRIPAYTKQIEEMDIKIADSIKELIDVVDVVLLETNDGRIHLEQAAQVILAGKPLFIDKPVAASLADAIAIFRLAEQHQVPVFTSSSLRYSQGAIDIRNGSIGKVEGAMTYSPAHLEPTHPDLFWYGIHGVEALFTVMGTGCQKVSRVSTEDTEYVTGLWDGGRIGSFRGIRGYKSGYGGTAFGETGIAEVGPYQGYRPLVVDIVRFFRTGVVPVESQESLEIYAFMEAADESKRQGGKTVSLHDVMKKASTAADLRLKEVLAK
ncbi:MAG: Gfo/Idh/MocA family oxidoreductase [Planctomycetota bacterium]|nr:Gfo/Idh/MocA family oxidoreductase [Planctomycetota bacterium]